MKYLVSNIYYIKSLVFCVVFISLTSCSSSDSISDGTSENENGEVVESDDEKDIVNDEEPENTNYDITPIFSIFDDNPNVVSYSVNGTNLVIETTNLPSHTSPYYLGTEWENDLYEEYTGTNASFRLNPNRIGEQRITLTIPLHPKVATTHEETPMGAIGVSRNGIVFFNQYAAGRSELTNEINSFDQNLGHPTGTSVYHYHIEPTYLTEVNGDDALLGVLLDGFPVYGPVENDVTLTSIDLDEYHGHYGATEEFPEGIYHYHVTADAPYINGDGFYGTPGNISN